MDNLLKRGANPGVNAEAYFPFHIVDSALLEGRYALAQRLVERGGDAKGLNVWNLMRNPRYPPAKPNRLRRGLFVKALTEVTCSPGPVQIRPLAAAAASDDALFFTRRLLAAGYSANEASDMGVTPLLAAIIAGRADVVALLLEHGADPNARYQPPITAYPVHEPALRDKTPLSLARERKLPVIVSLLKKAGA